MSLPRNSIKTAVIVAGVTLLLSFRFGIGTIYCFNNSATSAVYADRSCWQVGQPHYTLIDYDKSTNPTDPTTNPCPLNTTPFYGGLTGLCTQTTPGTDHYRVTLP